MSRGPRDPSRGEVWRVDFNPTRGHEQAGTRPALVLSVDTLNHGPAGLVIVVPITGADKGIPSHVRIDPPEGGVIKPSFIQCEDLRSVSKARLGQCHGRVQPATLRDVELRVRDMLGL